MIFIEQDIDMKELRNEAFWKGLKVIQSCENMQHIKVARNYMNRYVEIFCTNKKGVFIATESIATQYETLKVALEEQVKKLN